MRILTRYILGEILSHTLIGCALFTFILFMPQLPHILEVVVRNSSTWSDVAEIFLFTLPNLFRVTIPMSVLVGILLGLSRLAADSSELAKLVEEPRLAFASPAADAEIRAAGFALPPRSGNYFLDNYKFFVARYRPALWHLLGGEIPLHATRTYLGRPPADARQWASDAVTLKARTAHYADRADGNLGAMDRLVQLFPDRDKVKIVLLEIPLNPRAEAEVLGEDFVAGHRARLRAFAQKEGVLYWDLNESAGLSPSDFQDWAHINTATGQDRWTGQLIEKLVPLIQGQGPVTQDH